MIPKAVIICTVSTFVAVACVHFLLYFFSYRHDKKATSLSSLEDGPLKVSYHSLLRAMNGFFSIDLVYVANFGSMYKGRLDQT